MFLKHTLKKNVINRNEAARKTREHIKRSFVCAWFPFSPNELGRWSREISGDDCYQPCTTESTIENGAPNRRTRKHHATKMGVNRIHHFVSSVNLSTISFSPISLLPNKHRKTQCTLSQTCKHRRKRWGMIWTTVRWTWLYSWVNKRTAPQAHATIDKKRLSKSHQSTSRLQEFWPHSPTPLLPIVLGRGRTSKLPEPYLYIRPTTSLVDSPETLISAFVKLGNKWTRLVEFR